MDPNNSPQSTPGGPAARERAHVVYDGKTGEVDRALKDCNEAIRLAEGVYRADAIALGQGDNRSMIQSFSVRR